MHVGSSSPTRDRTWAPCIGSMESYPLDHQGSPYHPLFLKNFFISSFHSLESGFLIFPRNHLIIYSANVTEHLLCATHHVRPQGSSAVQRTGRTCLSTKPHPLLLQAACFDSHEPVHQLVNIELWYKTLCWARWVCEYVLEGRQVRSYGGGSGKHKEDVCRVGALGKLPVQLAMGPRLAVWLLIPLALPGHIGRLQSQVYL